MTAQRFAVLDGDGSALTSPFVVQGGQVFISQALIGTGWITNAMIGNTIQSNNFVSGQQGWQIDKAGTIEINGAGSAATSQMRITGQSLVIYQNGIDVIHLGVDL